MDYKGVAMPIMIVEAGEDGSKRREHEVHAQLPPIVSAHHHDDLAGHEGIHQHHHGGRAHRLLPRAASGRGVALLLAPPPSAPGGVVSACDGVYRIDGTAFRFMCSKCVLARSHAG